MMEIMAAIGGVLIGAGLYFALAVSYAINAMEKSEREQNQDD